MTHRRSWHPTYAQWREGQDLWVSREKAGRYSIRFKDQTWRIWRGINRRWYGECPKLPGQMVDALTLQMAKNDIRKGYFVKCASAGIGTSQRAWEIAQRGPL